MKRISVYIIEDNSILRDGIATLIDEQPDLKVVAASAGGHDAMKHVRATKPDIVLMDMSLRSEGDLSTLTSLTQELPKCKIIGMGLIPTQQDVIEFVEAGASGFILKDATVDVVLATIRSVAKGTGILPPALTDSLFTHVVDHSLRRGRTKLRSAARMTKREREIIILISDGMSNKEIAERLNLSRFTIKSHVHNILEKMALHSRLQIISSLHGDERR